MDVESMHPFCLPFSLCHDATSSVMATDSAAATSGDPPPNDCNASSPARKLNGNHKDKLQLLRSKSCSPSDDDIQLFAASQNSSLTCRSLLDEEDDNCLIGTTSIDDHLYTHLDLEEDGVELATKHTDLMDDDDDDDFGFHDAGNTSADFCKHHHDDNWCSNSYLSFPSNCKHNHRPSGKQSVPNEYHQHHQQHNHHHHHHHLLHHQVFQHVNDPLDIKSSPTLAQLNLNSSDDPNEGLWDTAATPAGVAATVMNLTCTSNSTATSTDLSSNSTSIYKGFSNNCTRINPVTATCNLAHPRNNHHHLQQHHNQQQHYLAHSQLERSATSQDLSSQLAAHQPLSLCHHHLHHHHQQPTGRLVGPQATLAGAFPTLATLNRNPNEQQPTVVCSNHHHHHHHQQQQQVHQGSTSCNQDAKSRCSLAGLTSPRAVGQLDCRLSGQTAGVHSSPGDGTQMLQDPIRATRHSNNTPVLGSSQAQRCASPALVTSSSSPLSTSAAQPSTGVECDNTLKTSTDNKLKENIEYLTALLCNGANKLQPASASSSTNSSSSSSMNNNNNNPQSSTISSTMIKSYTTLTQTLSTGPRLLERQQVAALPNGATMPINMAQHQQMGPLHSNQQQQQQQQMPPQLFRQQHISPGEGANPNHRQQQQQFSVQPSPEGNLVMRPCPEHWFKPAVESSVSVADSTAENHTTSTQVSIDNSRTNEPSTMAILQTNACAHYYNQVASNHFPPRESASLAGQKPGELRVLSSLLGSEKGACPALANCNGHLVSQASSLTTGGCNHNNPLEACNRYTSSYQAAGQLAPQVYGQTLAPTSESSVQQDNISIPPNGRPITLTPISNNGIIVQQQRATCKQNQAAAGAKLKTPLFAQPASPSTSSTTSSLSSTEITNSSSSLSAGSVPSSKRQKTNAPNAEKGSTSSGGLTDQSGRTNSMSTDCSLSSHDEGFSSQVDNDDCNSTRDSDEEEEDEVDSDDESFYGDYTNNDLIGASISDDAECKWTLNMGRTRRNGQKRFFWQYNVQSKGPKGARMCSADGNDDNPFVLPEASDPVFSSDCQIEGVKHSGKARRGDGNDLTPNPRKLLMIGLELKKLGRIINELVPVTDLPLNARNKTRKEKNKLASRACRLKKKAQHEANKIKLYGLQREHQQVVLAIYDIRKYLLGKSASSTLKQAACDSKTADRLLAAATLDSRVETMADNCSMRVAGQTSDYVNSVLEKVVSGCIDGGLQT